LDGVGGADGGFVKDFRAAAEAAAKAIALAATERAPLALSFRREACAWASAYDSRPGGGAIIGGSEENWRSL